MMEFVCANQEGFMQSELLLAAVANSSVDWQRRDTRDGAIRLSLNPTKVISSSTVCNLNSRRRQTRARRIRPESLSY